MGMIFTHTNKKIPQYRFENGATINGKNLLPEGANSFR